MPYIPISILVGISLTLGAYAGTLLAPHIVSLSIAGTELPTYAHNIENPDSGRLHGTFVSLDPRAPAFVLETATGSIRFEISTSTMVTRYSFRYDADGAMIERMREDVPFAEIPQEEWRTGKDTMVFYPYRSDGRLIASTIVL